MDDVAWTGSRSVQPNNLADVSGAPDCGSTATVQAVCACSDAVGLYARGGCCVAFRFRGYRRRYGAGVEVGVGAGG